MFAKEDIEIEVADAIMEKPYGFSVGNQHFYLYPMTLGKTLLLTSHIKALGIDEEKLKSNPYLEMLSIVKQRKAECAKVIAYHTFKCKEDLFDVEKIGQRASFLIENAEDADLSTLLVLSLTKDQQIAAFSKHFHIDKDKERMRKVLKVKENKNNYTFGGKSLYGSLIDSACQRYGWTMDYVVWGISYTNLQMLLLDQQSSIYLSDAERKHCHVSQDGAYINGDSKENMRRIRAQFSD